MDQRAVEAAYQPFVAELRTGGFVTPTEGWCAEVVAAHVAVNNDLIAAAAELVVAGQHPRYDNGAAVDDTQLLAYGDGVGGLSGLATAVATSAQRLGAVMGALDQTAATYMLPVRIVDAGKVVHDGPIPIGAFIEGNATFHLDNHLEQIRLLRP